MWRNWQTRTTQNRVGFARVGSTPTIGIENREKALGSRVLTNVRTLSLFLPNTFEKRKSCAYNRVR